jgi:hypothetical protein
MSPDTSHMGKGKTAPLRETLQKLGHAKRALPHATREPTAYDTKRMNSNSTEAHVTDA